MFKKQGVLGKIMKELNGIIENKTGEVIKNVTFHTTLTFKAKNLY